MPNTQIAMRQLKNLAYDTQLECVTRHMNMRRVSTHRTYAYIAAKHKLPHICRLEMSYMFAEIERLVTHTAMNALIKKETQP